MLALAIVVMAPISMLAMGIDPSLAALADGLIILFLRVRLIALYANCSTQFVDFVKRQFGRDHKPSGVLAVATHRGFALIERHNAWEGRGIFHRSHQHNQRLLLSCVSKIEKGVNWFRRRSLETYILATVRQKASRGRLSDLSNSPHRSIQLWTAAIACGIHGDKDITPLADLALSDFKAGSIVYRLPHGTLLPKMFEQHRCYFEQLLEGPVMISTGNAAGSVLVKRLPKLPAIIRYRDVHSERKRQGLGNIALGVDLITGKPVFVPFREMMHMQIAGVSGYGKSTFLQSFIQQCLQIGDEIEKILVIDLKGTDFNSLTCSKFEVFFEYEKIPVLVAQMVAEMELRLASMRKDSLSNWARGRILVVVDEFAQLVYQNADPHLSSDERKKHKAIQDKMIADLCRLGMLGRAAGITLICATQKPTADAIPTALRHNLDAAIIFRSSRLLTSSIISETDSLIFEPKDLPKGHAIAWLNGAVRYLQSYVA